VTHLVVPHFQNTWRIFKSRPGAFVGAMMLLFASWVALEIAVAAGAAFPGLGLLVTFPVSLLAISAFYRLQQSAA